MNPVKSIVAPLALVVCLASGLISTNGNAGVIRNLEFNTPGVLPSADPQIELFNNTGTAETTLFNVTGGLLEQRTRFEDGNATYSFPDTALSGGGLDAALATTLETRLRVNSINGNGGVAISAFDGAARYTLSFTVGAVRVFHGASQFEVINLDISQFHTYRIDSAGGTSDFDFFIDDVLTFSGVAVASTSNGFNFGDGTTTAGNGANADWDFIRVSQEDIAVIPEPPVSLLFIGMAALVLARRRR